MAADQPETTGWLWFFCHYFLRDGLKENRCRVKELQRFFYVCGSGDSAITEPDGTVAAPVDAVVGVQDGILLHVIVVEPHRSVVAITAEAEQDNDQKQGINQEADHGLSLGHVSGKHDVVWFFVG
ncbi:MAG: hypothetical protein CSA79_04025 [Thiothrix nivea]|nr:MAG: hypothetical protein CSA79_04025 [Thiothrix nivea]